ncbi:MAG: HEPN domain-containing protein [Bacteroidales bacterium]|nr:HEPN domain-containing protein [Bacteroidales bacterium]MBR6929814.1 HEPN domain-containing protein [Bacteroidales bacterium]
MANDKVAYWIDIAEYDIGTAESLFKTKRWLYVAFMCHQAIEKTLKAYWSGTREDDPPYTHNHKRLASGCGLYEQMSDEQRKFIETVTNYNIEARYPEDKDALYRQLSKQACRQMIDETKQLMQWIIEELSAAKKPLNLSADTSES